jgi:3-deoxy-D-manno-octulosonic acid kinase
VTSAGLPAGYVTRRERGAEFVALPSVMEAVVAAVREAGSLHAWAAGQPGARGLAGRGTAWAVQGSDGAWVVRHYRRGGLLAGVLGDRYLALGRRRPVRELAASAAARALGVPTPEVVAAVVYPGGPAYRAELATRLVPDGADLAETVLGPGRGGQAERLAAWRAAASLLRRAFDAGVVHADLNMRNILVARGDGGPEAWLLDLDRARVLAGPVGRAGRRRMLQRLDRSRRKLEAAWGVESDVNDLQLW